MAKQNFVDFLESMRGPYYIETYGNDGRTLRLVMLDPDDKEDFKKRYLNWKENPDATSINAGLLIRQVLADYKPKNKKLLALSREIKSLLQTTEWGDGIKAQANLSYEDTKGGTAKLESIVYTAMLRTWHQRPSFMPKIKAQGLFK